MNKYIFECGNGQSLTVQAESVEEALANLFPKPGSFLGYYSSEPTEGEGLNVPRSEIHARG